MIHRQEFWYEFSDTVSDHIETYTFDQYGDYPDDQLTGWTAEQCIENIKRYCNRFSSNARGDAERERDLLKIAHYAQTAWTKLKGLEDES
jgi:hypothetical protein